MLRSLREVYGKKLGASDGDIGHVKDFYFNDQQWAIRYVVADTGSWLSGRLVLISPHAFGNLHQNCDCLLVNLTRQQIENSPAIESHKPVSLRYQAYWDGVETWGAGGFPEAPPPPHLMPSTQASDDVHLQSTQRLLAATPSKPAKERSATSLILSWTTGVGRFVTSLWRPAIGILARRSLFHRSISIGSVTRNPRYL